VKQRPTNPPLEPERVRHKSTLPPDILKVREEQDRLDYEEGENHITRKESWQLAMNNRFRKKPHLAEEYYDRDNGNWNNYTEE
jgi:hypothetical protein